MYITDGYRPACDTGHSYHLEIYAYACLTSSRVRNPAFDGADGFFTHSDMAWPTLIRGTTNMYSHAVTCEMTDSTHECDSRIVHRSLMQRGTCV